MVHKVSMLPLTHPGRLRNSQRHTEREREREREREAYIERHIEKVKDIHTHTFSMLDQHRVRKHTHRDKQRQTESK